MYICHVTPSPKFTRYSIFRNKFTSSTNTAFFSLNNTTQPLYFIVHGWVYVCIVSNRIMERVVPHDSTLPSEQQDAIECVVNKRENVFITGSAGVGKTYVLKEIVKQLRQRRLVVAVTASTGVAAFQIGGTTVHHFAGVGLAKENVDTLVKKIFRWGPSCDRWTNADVLVIDEISMLDPKFFSKLDAIARWVRKTPSLPFGGIQMVFFGDFFQLMPVSDSDDACALNFCFECPEWNQCLDKVICLEQVHRQKDTTFVEMLNRIRRGICTDEDEVLLQSRINADLTNVTQNLGIEPTRLFPHRASAEDVNRNRLSTIREQTYRFDSKQDVCIHGRKTPADTEKLTQHGHGNIAVALRQLTDQCPAEPTFYLKKGAQVMLLVNLNTEEGLANGSRGVVEGFEVSRNIMGEYMALPKVTFMNTQTHVIDYHEWKREDKRQGWSIRYEQVPLMLAWAVTIHKSQGLTLDLAEMDLGKNVFTDGQAYVALSRVRSLNGMRLLRFEKEAIRAHPLVEEYYTRFAGQHRLGSIEIPCPVRFPTEEEIKKMADEFEVPCTDDAARKKQKTHR